MAKVDENLEPTIEAPQLELHTYLVVEEKGDVIAKYPIVDGNMTIGRTKHNHVRINDSNISRLHAQILTVDNQSLIEDMGSRNGTYYKRKLVKRRTMKPGERFRISYYTLYLEQRSGDNELAKMIGGWDRGIEPDTTMEIPMPVF